MARRIFIYEFITGGGMLAEDAQGPLSGSLLSEGAAMIAALAADFAALHDCRVAVMLDARLSVSPFAEDAAIEVQRVATAEQQRQTFSQLSAAADWSVVIAPEFDGILLAFCRQALAVGGRLLGPGPDCVELTADKHRTAEFLRERRIAAPLGIAAEGGASAVDVVRDFLAAGGAFPAVLKPRFGAGSQSVRLLADATELQRLLAERSGEAMRLECFHAGQPVSVAVLCGPRQLVPLTACRQELSSDGRFQYLGGSLPLDLERNQRARDLALRTVACLPLALGYVGCDLVLGDSSADDSVIEINPRLTTSYIGLRRAYRQNLAAAMLALAELEMLDSAAWNLAEAAQRQVTWSVADDGSCGVALKNQRSKN